MFHSFEQQNLLDLRFLLENSANAIEDSLQNFAKLPGFDEQMMLAFGNDINVHGLKEEWRSHNFTFPDIEVVSNNTINGSNGAFSSDTNTIYISAEFLTANQFDLDTVNSVLLEEYGHYLDNEFNSVDSPGDEGAIFSAVVRGEKLTDSELQQLRNEDDSAVVTIDGESVAIEQNELIVESLFDATIQRDFEFDSDGNVIEGDEEIFFQEAVVTGSNWWSVNSGSWRRSVGIVEFLLPDPKTITPNTEIILRLHDAGGKISDNPQDFSENPTVTDNSIIVSGYIGDGEATVSDRDISATQITTITTDAEQRGSSGNFPDDDPYLVDVTNFVVNAINSGEEIVGFRFTTNSASTFEAFVGPGFDDPIGLVFESSENQSTVEFKENVIDATEGSNSTVTLVRTGDLSEELTVDITVPPTADDFLMALLDNSNTLLSVSRGFSLIKEGIEEAANIVIRRTVGEKLFKLYTRQSVFSTILKGIDNALIPIQIAQSVYDQSKAENKDDFSLSTTSVTFAPNQKTATFDLTFEEDLKREGDQSFYMDLSSPFDPSINDTALAVIRGDDGDVAGIDFGNTGDLQDLTINGIAGIISGAISGSVGGLPGIAIGGLAGGLGATVLTDLGEIIEDVAQSRLIEYQIAGIEDDDESSLFPSFIDAIYAGTDDSDNVIDIEELDGFASSGGGNDTLNGNSGDDVMNGDAGADVLSGGAGTDSLTGGAGADTLTGGADSDIFAGTIEELNQDVITDFAEEDIIGIDGVLITSENLTITEGSAIIDIDTDLNGESDATITLEGDFSDRKFFVETVSLGNFDTSFILLESTEPAIEEIAGETVYRFFNPSAGVHFYTASEVERDVVLELPNYSFEGESYNTVDPLSGEAEDVYRFFNTDTGVHLYTTDENERDFIIENLAEFTFEETAFSAYETGIEGAIPIHRFYEPSIGVHFYTPNETERMFVEDNLSNYTYEGIAYYAFPLDGIV